MNKLLFKTSLLSSLICLSLYSYADDYFDPAMLESQLGVSPTQIDLSQFSASNSMPSGEYIFRVEINQTLIGDEKLSFVPDKSGNMTPELTPALLEKWGVNVNAITNLRNLPSDTKITELSDYIKDSSVTVQTGKLNLLISVPQIAMQNKAQGYIDPSLLDNGITALFFNYFLSGNKNWSDSESGHSSKNDSAFATVNTGVNLGVWRARSTISYSRSGGDFGSQSSTTFNNTYIMRALHAIRSTVMAGEISTGNDVFDSLPFKGIKLASDEDMLPSSLRGFSPDVSGIAQSNARVTIRQNGYIVYQTYVAAGPFKINDIYATGNAGDLDVTITEENGSERTFTVAFSSLPVMQRPGGYKYEISSGRYNGGYTVGSKESDFILASLSYGLPINSTLYGGLLAADGYVSVVGGVGTSLGVFGALSADITHASADMRGTLGDQTGQSYRLRYSKSMTTTGTSVDLTALRYSSSTYYSFADFNNQDYRLKDDVAPWLNQRQRASFTTSLSQSLGDYGSIFLSGSISDYWDSDREIRQVSVGYNGALKGINYSVRYNIDRVKDKEAWPENRQISISVNVPFSIFSNSETARNMSSNYMFSRDSNGVQSQQLSLNGSLQDNKFSYGISQGYTNQGTGASGSLNGSYAGSKGTVSAGYNYSKYTQSMNASLNGGVMIHSGGILLGKATGGSMAIVEAQGASGAQVGSPDNIINSSGYALYPYVSPYSANMINIDVNTLPQDVLLKDTSKTTYPSAGAIVKVKFDTKLGYQAIINLKTKNGQSIPFGAIATLVNEKTEEENTGIVGDNNQLFMSGLPESGKLNIGWGSTQNQQCTAAFSGLGKTEINQTQPVRSVSLSCD